MNEYDKILNIKKYFWKVLSLKISNRKNMFY